MKDNSLLKLGGACAVLLGIAKIVSAVGYLLLPPEQRAAVPGVKFLPSFAANPTLLLTVFWAEAIVGILGLVVVPAISRQLRAENEGWVNWTSSLALLGFAVSAVGYVLSVARVPVIAAAYVAGDASTKAALAVTWRSSPDLLGLWGYGVIGVWVLVVSLLGLRGTTFPKILMYVGIALAVLYGLVPFGIGLKSQPLLLIAVSLGGLAAPIWYIWSGLVLRRVASAS